MIVLLGTKGQVIKVASVMKEMDRLNIPYKYVQTNQHPKMNAELEKVFGLKKPDLYLSKRKKDLGSPSEIPIWFFKCLVRVFTNRALFKNEDFMIIQGDTISTFMGCIIGKLFRMKVAHIEAGLRSYGLLDPFPEELIRYVVSVLSNILFAPTDYALENLRHFSGLKFHTGQNTVYDILAHFLDPDSKKADYIIAAIHRQETIYNPRRFKKAVEVVQRASKIKKVIYILHKTSEQQLKNTGLYDSIKNNPNIETTGYKDYLTFMKMVSQSEFVISDGGGLQEETYFLDVPILILRNRTERKYGLGETACLSKFNDKVIEYFFEHYPEFRRKDKFVRKYPSRKIVSVLLKLKKFYNK
ncbi:UDP-N-acetylglucosamine 2-epimerase [bacterium]|nr:UDP-N-acetylglucosamine 2-epimerase [bacterium]